MKDCREEYYDAEAKVRIIFADVADAAQRLALGHLNGPASARILAEHLAAAALLGAEIGDEDETVIIQMKCSGPLRGLTVECARSGALRGYTEKKTLDDFDDDANGDLRRAIGERRYQITRSVPGRIVSQGVAATLGGYLTQSLQRNAEIKVEAAVSDSVEVLEARGVLVEALPDSPLHTSDRLTAIPLARLPIGAAPRTILKKLGFPHAELKSTAPLFFACRCSEERVKAALAALPEEDRASLGTSVDITCHMCGKTWTVKL